MPNSHKTGCPDCRASLPGDGSCCDRCGWNLQGGGDDPRLPSGRTAGEIAAAISPPLRLVGMAAGLEDIHGRLQRAIRRINEMAPANGNYDDQNQAVAELQAVASDLRRWFDPAYARRLDSQRPLRRRPGGNRAS